MKELNSFRKYLRISESFNESLSEFIDKSDELSKLPPEDVQGAKDALEQVYNEGNIVSPQNIDQVPNKPGVYFLWMSSEGAKVIDDIVKELGVEDDKQLTGGCTIKSIKGKTYLLVYVGRIYGSLNKRLGDHMARKDFNLSAITTGGDSVFTQKLGSLLSKGGGRDNQYYENANEFEDGTQVTRFISGSPDNVVQTFGSYDTYNGGVNLNDFTSGSDALGVLGVPSLVHLDKLNPKQEFGTLYATASVTVGGINDHFTQALQTNVSHSRIAEHNEERNYFYTSDGNALRLSGSYQYSASRVQSMAHDTRLFRAFYQGNILELPALNQLSPKAFAYLNEFKGDFLTIGSLKKNHFKP